MICNHVHGFIDPLRTKFECSCGEIVPVEKVTVNQAIAGLPRSFEEFRQRTGEPVERLRLGCPWITDSVPATPR